MDQIQSNPKLPFTTRWNPLSRSVSILGLQCAAVGFSSPTVSEPSVPNAGPSAFVPLSHPHGTHSWFGPTGQRPSDKMSIAIPGIGVLDSPSKGSKHHCSLPPYSCVWRQRRGGADRRRRGDGSEGAEGRGRGSGG